MQIYYAEDKSDQVAVRHIVRPIHEAVKSTYCYLSLGRDLAFANVKKGAKKTQLRKLQSRELCSNRRRLKLMYQQSKYQSKHIFELISVELPLLLSLYALMTYSVLYSLSSCCYQNIQKSTEIR
jgi:hypothetical protein